MDGLFEKIDDTQSHSVLHHLKGLWNISQYSKMTPFPMPVDLARENLCKMKELTYVCATKTDGLRAMLALFRNGDIVGAYMITRKLEVYSIRLNIDCSFFRQKGSLFDCEVLPCLRKIVVFDCYYSKGHCQMRKSYLGRLFEVEVLLSSVLLQEPKFEISSKKIYEMSNFAQLSLEMEKNDLPVDGVIFTPKNTPCTPGANRTLFKFKFENTVDLKIGSDGSSLLWNTPHGPAPLSYMKSKVLLSKSSMQIIRDYRAVYEFTVVYSSDLDAIMLHCTKQRHDKKTANFFTVVQNIFDMALDRLHLNEIFEALGQQKPEEEPKAFISEIPIVFNVRSGDNQATVNITGYFYMVLHL